MPSPNGRPPSDSRPCGSRQLPRSGPAGTIPVGAWSTIVVTANVNTASIEVNNEVVATNLPKWSTATTLYGYTFASSGTAPVGDNFLIDDVLFTS